MMASPTVLKTPTKFLVLVVVIWAAWALATEIHRVWAPEPEDPPRLGTSRLWRLGDEPVGELEAFLARADSRIPAASVVAVRSRSGRDDFFFSTWCAFYLPRHDIVRAELDWAWKTSDYLLAYGKAVEDPRLREIWRNPAGVLYEVRRP